MLDQLRLINKILSEKIVSILVKPIKNIYISYNIILSLPATVKSNTRGAHTAHTHTHTQQHTHAHTNAALHDVHAWWGAQLAALAH